MIGPEVQIISCDRFGQNTCEHPDAVAEAPARKEVMPNDSFSFSVPLTDPFLGLLEPIKREVQVWRNGILRWWGVIVRAPKNVAEGVRTVECQGPEYYFTRLQFGKAGRTNFLANGSFDDNPASMHPWVPLGVVANLTDKWGVRPGQTYQLNLYQGGAGLDTFVQQQVTVEGGRYYDLSARFHIRTDAQWVGPALDNRGLYVELMNPDVTAAEAVQFFAIDDNTPRGTFEVANTGIHVPPGPPRVLRVRLYATRCTSPAVLPNGGIIWDNVKLTVMESQSFVNQDLGDAFNNIVIHAQEAAYGKTDLNITPASTTTGIRVDRTYQHVDHTRISDAFRELAEEGTCEYGIETPTPTTRLLKAYVPRKGRALANPLLELDAERGIILVGTIDCDGSRTVNSVIAADDAGSGPGRDEAAAIDTSGTDGIVLEETITSKDWPDRLFLVAGEYLRTHKDIVEVPEIVVAAELMDEIDVGDVVPIVIKTPGVDLEGQARIVATEWDPRDDSFALTLNAAPA